MTERELIDALAVRIEDAVTQAQVDADPNSDGSTTRGVPLWAAAREALRQMRFAYACGINEASDSSSFHGCAGSQPAGLDTIAPSDWQP